MGCRSSIINDNRNPGLTEEEANALFKTYYGVKKIIWLDGIKGKDITDGHIDGFVKLVNQNTLLTFPKEDLKYWELSDNDIQLIYSATNANNEPYKIVQVPLTKNDV